MKGKSGSLYFGEYQAGMRKFTLAGKTGDWGVTKRGDTLLFCRDNKGIPQC